MRRLASAVLVLLVPLGACSSKTGSPPASTGAATLDPSQPQFGKTYSEWTVAWWQWWYQMPQPAAAAGDAGVVCIDPINDPTGAQCAASQDDPNVFFLAGSFGTHVERDECVAPAGKALFFPVINNDWDNAGVPVAQQLTPAQLQQQAIDNRNNAGLTTEGVEVDGQAVAGLSPLQNAYSCGPTGFSYTMPPEPNRYTCLGTPGVVGVIDPSYSTGDWVMIPPLSAGQHIIHIYWSEKNKTTSATSSMDVTYHLTVQ